MLDQSNTVLLAKSYNYANYLYLCVMRVINKQPINNNYALIKYLINPISVNFREHRA
jgi:hypothetical protein